MKLENNNNNNLTNKIITDIFENQNSINAFKERLSDIQPKAKIIITKHKESGGSDEIRVEAEILRKRLQAIRIDNESKRKLDKAPILKKGKELDAKAKEISKAIKPLEDYMKLIVNEEVNAQRKQIENRRGLWNSFTDLELPKGFEEMTPDEFEKVSSKEKERQEKINTEFITHSERFEHLKDSLKFSYNLHNIKIAGSSFKYKGIAQAFDALLKEIEIANSSFDNKDFVFPRSFDDLLES